MFYICEEEVAIRQFPLFYFAKPLFFGQCSRRCAFYSMVFHHGITHRKRITTSALNYKCIMIRVISCDNLRQMVVCFASNRAVK